MVTNDSKAIRWFESDKMAAMFTRVWLYRIKINFNFLTSISFKTPTITAWIKNNNFHLFVKLLFIAWQKPDLEQSKWQCTMLLGSIQYYCQWYQIVTVDVIWNKFKKQFTMFFVLIDFVAAHKPLMSNCVYSIDVI